MSLYGDFLIYAAGADAEFFQRGGGWKDRGGGGLVRKSFRGNTNVDKCNQNIYTQNSNKYTTFFSGGGGCFVNSI